MTEALRLAEFLDSLDVRSPDRIQNCVSAAAELRRLHSVNAQLLEACTAIVNGYKHKGEELARAAIAAAKGEA